MDQARTSPRTLITALLAALVLIALTLLLATGLPGLGSSEASNGWKSPVALGGPGSNGWK